MSRIKIMGGLNIAEKRLPQDGRIRLKIAGRDYDVRLSTVPIVPRRARGACACCPAPRTCSNLERHRLRDKEQLEVMEKLIARPERDPAGHRPHGQRQDHHPVRRALPDQRHGQEHHHDRGSGRDPAARGGPDRGEAPRIGLTFSGGLRSVLRQDPNVILVGEIRDLETAEIAIQASLTGHLVFSTLHTNDAASAITRLVDMGVEPFLVASSLVAVLAQRLVRVLCKDCREQYEATRRRS